jgi:ATP-dependent DNA helicase RecQ
MTDDSRLTSHDSTLTIHDILKSYWGYDAFRPLQEDIIQAILAGKDTLALMPTGGGKSLCYQVPALAMEGMCLVISPLIALMKDQVENLRKRNITAYAIFSGMTRKEVVNILKVASHSNCKFLYVSPERLETSLFKEYLPALPINLIAVDEAHCISQWGYDFRPPYLRIAALREEIPHVPVLALTASATSDVQKDICDKLSNAKDQKKWELFRQSFERPALSYSVFQVESRINKIIEILQKVTGTAIVYCKSRRRAREISDLLKLQGMSAGFYHAGLNRDERNQRQEEWIQNKTRVIVCTNAFGMGIDKPDVRVVIHADVPDCLENYYQEAGRAGRDGKTSYAVLLHDEKDLHEPEQMAAIRFPTLEDIRTTYQAVANYLQVPSGSARGIYYDFDLADLIKKFKLDSQTVLYALKALEQEGWLSFNEQVFLPSTIVFNTGKDALYQFEQSHPELEPCIKTLLRAYSGIFDQPTVIFEKQVAGLMKKDPGEIKNQLGQLHQAGIIEYNPQKDSPQILFLRDRVRAEELSIDMTAYEKRKAVFLQRARQMISYVNESAQCRSRIIGMYFGDQDIKPCGICDNCLRQKAAIISKEEFETLHHRILNMVKYESLHTKDLLSKLTGIRKEKVWKLLEFLQAENKIAMDNTGLVRLKRH